MNFSHLALSLPLVLALLAPSASQSLAQPSATPAAPAPDRAPAAPGDEYWAAKFNPPGMDREVLALAVGPDGSLYAGGDFTTAGQTVANSIAGWDGAQWDPLSSGMGDDYLYVRALAVGPNGSLYAGGHFTAAGGKPSSYIAPWTG